jgi:hypothetical protein
MHVPALRINIYGINQLSSDLFNTRTQLNKTKIVTPSARLPDGQVDEG